MRRLTKEEALSLARDVELAGTTILESLVALRETIGPNRNIFRPSFLQEVNKKLSNSYMRYEYHSTYTLKFWPTIYSSRNGLRFKHPTSELESIFSVCIRLTTHCANSKCIREWQVGTDLQEECAYWEAKVLKTIAMYKDAAKRHGTYLKKVEALEKKIDSLSSTINPLFLRSLKLPNI